MTDVSSRLERVMSNDNEMKGAVQATSLLHQKANDIRSRAVTWQSYHKSQMITDRDFKFITAYETAQSPEARAEFLLQNGMKTPETFFSLLGSLSKDHTIQYVLCLMDEMFYEQRSRVDIFHEFCQEKKITVWSQLSSLLHREDHFIQNMTGLLIAKCACWSVSGFGLADEELKVYLNWLIEQLRTQTNEYIQTTARCLQLLLRRDDYRNGFVSLDGLSAIFFALKGRSTFQIQYQLIFCVWICTFDYDLALKMRNYSAIPNLADILSESLKEKVIRMILATFRNLIEKPSEDDPEIARENAITMVQCKVLKHLEILQQSGQKFEDPDIKEDIDYLYDKLQTSVQDLSSFDEYSTEVRSGRLEWSPVHTSEKFWHENAVRLNEKNYELLKILIRLLEASRDPLVLSVAAHDLGEYVRHYPRGKVVTENLGGKQYVMQLLAHEDPNVRYEALLCVQKLMVQNWEYLGKRLEQDAGKSEISAK